MARGTLFSTLVSRLRAASGRSATPSLGVSEEAKLKETINAVYETLYLGHDWPHLRKEFPRFALQAGDRYYDFPAGLNSERIESVTAWSGGVQYRLTRGIDPEHYSAYDSSAATPERSSPPQRWDIRWTGTEDQIEIWPMPNTNDYQLAFIGIQAAPRLVEDHDPCLLDDTVVVNFAAAELITDEKQAEKKLKMAQDRLNTLFGRGNAGMQSYQMGLGAQRTSPFPIVLRVGR